jgi:DUF4097 and DUF4098 domain-containing protein YvlB
MNRTKTAACAALLLLATAASASTVVEKSDRTYPLEGRAVSVKNVNGSVDVSVWDRPEVRVEAEKRVRGARRDSAAEALESVKIEVDQTSSELRIRTRYPNRHSFGFFDLFTNGKVQASVNYRITIPRAARLEVDTVNAAIQVAGVEGGTSVATVNGAIEVTGTAGPFKASTVNGSIYAALSDVPDGRLSAKSVNGKIRLALPAALRANVHVSTVNGKITSGIPVTARSMSRRSLEGEMNGGGGVDLAISTVNGSVTIEPN